MESILATAARTGYSDAEVKREIGAAARLWRSGGDVPLAGHRPEPIDHRGVDAAQPILGFTGSFLVLLGSHLGGDRFALEKLEPVRGDLRHLAVPGLELSDALERELELVGRSVDAREGLRPGLVAALPVAAPSILCSALR